MSARELVANRRGELNIEDNAQPARPDCRRIRDAAVRRAVAGGEDSVMSATFRPMLAATPDNVKDVQFPVYASPKLDGVRATVIDGTIRSRTAKTFPNAHVQRLFSDMSMNRFDGELIVGDPRAEDVFRVTSGATSRQSGAPDVRFHVFDLVVPARFEARQLQLATLISGASRKGLIELVPQHLCRTAEELFDLEEQALDQGYEGLILRSPGGLYKQGRSTVREGGMLKWKRFIDAEAEIIGMVEELHNENEAKRDAFGRTERSSHQENMKPTGRMGALIVRDCKTGVEFQIGTGFTMDDRRVFWQNQQTAMGWIIKYKSLPIGVKEKPRFPVYLGIRPQFDHDKGE
jgi:DNA ligase-1